MLENSQNWRRKQYQVYTTRPKDPAIVGKSKLYEQVTLKFRLRLWNWLMESSKTRPVSNTLAFSSIFLSLVVCFLALVHVEVELHAHRQMLQVLSHQRTDNFGPRKTVHDEPISSLHNSDAVEGKKMGECFFYKLFTCTAETWRRDIMAEDITWYINCSNEVISKMCKNNSYIVELLMITRAVLEKG